MPKESKYSVIAIPSGVAFADLKLTRDPITLNVMFDWTPIKLICKASDIDIATFTQQHEGNVSGLIVAWYAQHRHNGGDIDLTAEQLIAEAVAEDQYGETNIIGGAPKQ